MKAIPFFRRNSFASAALLVGLAVALFGTFFVGPSVAASGKIMQVLAGLLLGSPLLAVCVIVLTGDIYLAAFDAQGQLKKWGIGNKVVAVLILGGWIYSVVSSLM